MISGVLYSCMFSGFWYWFFLYFNWTKTKTIISRIFHRLLLQQKDSVASTACLRYTPPQSQFWGNEIQFHIVVKPHVWLSLFSFWYWFYCFTFIWFLLLIGSCVDQILFFYLLIFIKTKQFTNFEGIVLLNF